MFTWGPRETGGGGDPYFAQVLVLLHGEGANGGTVFTDSSSYGRSFSIASGSPTTSTAQYKFGSASITGPFPNSRIVTSQSGSEWAASSWTFETWYRRSANTDYNGLLYANNGNFNVKIKGLVDLGAYEVFVLIGGFSFLTSTSATVLDTWTHIAVSVEHTGPGATATVRVFFNGVLEASSTSASAALLSTGGLFEIGRADLAAFAEIYGFIDEYRVTAACRYTASFTPPSAPFPDS